MNKRQRIKKDKEFQQVFKNRKSFANRQFIVYIYRKEQQLEFRVGLSVSKKVGNAVVRNKLKRRIKEVNRMYLPNLKKGYDLIFIPKKNAVDLSFAELESAIKHIYRISGMAEKVN